MMVFNHQRPVLPTHTPAHERNFVVDTNHPNEVRHVLWV
jgi:hypothetical protein